MKPQKILKRLPVAFIPSRILSCFLLVLFFSIPVQIVRADPPQDLLDKVGTDEQARRELTEKWNNLDGATRSDVEKYIKNPQDLTEAISKNQQEYEANKKMWDKAKLQLQGNLFKLSVRPFFGGAAKAAGEALKFLKTPDPFSTVLKQALKKVLDEIQKQGKTTDKDLKIIVENIATVEKYKDRMAENVRRGTRLLLVQDKITEIGEIISKARPKTLDLELPFELTGKTNTPVSLTIQMRGGNPPYTVTIRSADSAFDEISIPNKRDSQIRTDIVFKKAGTFWVDVEAVDSANKRVKKSVTARIADPGEKAGIKIQKAADARNVKPGEKVTYVYSLTNTGTVQLERITVKDDKCLTVAPLKTDPSGILNPNDTWTYQCVSTLMTTTENTATVEAYSLTNAKVTDQAKATVTVGPCPPPQVKVPNLLYKTSDEARTDVQKNGLRFWVGKPEYSDSFSNGTVMDQDPREGRCVDPGSTVNAILSQGPKPDKPSEEKPAKLTAELDCGDSFELRPGDFLGKACNVVVKGWKGNTSDRVELKIEYDRSSGIEVSGDASVSPDLMYTAGVSPYNDRYLFKQTFRAKDNAPQGTTTVALTVSQKGAGEVSLLLRVAVLAKGQLPGAGPGIRPPATVVAGSGGNYCVWRYKMFGDPPPCFHFAAAVCGKYGPPGYELVGDRMTWGEADARVGQLSRYFDDQYECSSSTGAQTPPAAAGPTTLNATLDCGGALELVPGEMSKPCNVIVGGWQSEKAERINVKIRVADGPFLGKIETIPGNTSVDPGNIYASYTSGGKSYLISEGFAARSNAPPGTAKVTITVSQTGAGQVSVPLDLLVLPKGATASSGAGIRPPATVAAGSGGNYCVWRYKMFGDPPPCFHFAAAVCGKYGPPSYELVGDRMTWGEADARVGQLSRYFDDQYGCSAATAKPPQQTTPAPPKPPAAPPPPPPPCQYEYWDWSDCQPDNTRSRTVRSSTPEGCTGTPILIGTCAYTPPPPVLTRFGVFCSPGQIDQNGTAACKATGEYSNAIGAYVDLTARASWKNGPIFEGKGRRDGSYPVTATLEGASDTATVTVLKGYDPNKDPGIPGRDKPVDPNTIKGPMDGFAAGPGQGTRPEKPGQQDQPPMPIPTEYTKPPGEPPKPPDQPGTQPPSTPGATQQPTKPGIDVTVVGTAPAGKCAIVTGQLVKVEGWPEKIAGMTVTLTGPANKTATSSAGGAFSFSDIPAGKYVMSVTQWNYGMTKADFVCESGKAVKVVMKGSCPYLYVWTGEAYEKENDIYPVARLLARDLMTEESRLLAEKQESSIFLFTPEHITEKVIRQKNMRDDYRITRALVPDSDGNYRLRIVEQATEHSFTDWVGLSAVEHRKGTRIGMSRGEQPFLYQGLQPLSSFQKPAPLYDGEFLEIEVPPEAWRNGFIALTWQGFLEGKADRHTASPGQPKLTLQRQDPQGKWRNVDWIYPRDERQESFFPLPDQGPGWDRENKIRIAASSCDPEKYHRVDEVSWGRLLPDSPRASRLKLLSAAKATGEKVLELLREKDGQSLMLGPEEAVDLVFEGIPLDPDREISLVFLSEGFYVPFTTIRLAAH